MTTLAIETIGLSKTFKQTAALKAVDLRLHEGEILAILGPNGAGKTTLLKILSTLVHPDEGQARIFGYDVVKQDRQAKQKLSLAMGEERSFYWRLSGRQNLEFFAALYNLTAEETRSKIKEAVSVFDLLDLDKPYQEYSTGNKSRLALARSFLHDAPLVLMDEPTRSLDIVAAASLRKLLRETLKAQKRSVVFTTHQMEEAETVADRVAILCQGQVQFCSTVEEFRKLRETKKLSALFHHDTEPL